MFRKPFAVLATVALVAAPLTAQAQHMPTPAPASQPAASGGQGPGVNGLVVVAALLVIAGVVAHRR
ncbi:hypothetical protein DS901_00650 [Loktanella sp. D2R18]|uniref:hypothetical protein n=1 Tax=Rhodobacterales TaxID=204455 RepID=UPI000DE932DF|nr:MULTISPECIES: hypothetical protein [Rhodobacterales]MDO6591305.1 hypothetical protein [Yoonia sp. 1_MG-2023]RBW46257.1 hypothetical protein DS901_00650 [Loktanella sp. D2R18]